MKQNTTVDTKDLVTTIAYLIGVSVNCVQRFSVRLRKPMMKCDTI